MQFSFFTNRKFPCDILIACQAYRQQWDHHRRHHHHHSLRQQQQRAPHITWCIALCTNTLTACRDKSCVDQVFGWVDINHVSLHQKMLQVQLLAPLCIYVSVCVHVSTRASKCDSFFWRILHPPDKCKEIKREKRKKEESKDGEDGSGGGYSGGMNRIQRITIAMAMAVVEPFTMPD